MEYYNELRHWDAGIRYVLSGKLHSVNRKAYECMHTVVLQEIGRLA